MIFWLFLFWVCVGWNIYTIHDIVVKAIQHNLNLQYYYSNYKNVGKESNGLDTTYSDNRNFVHVKQPLLRTLRRKLLSKPLIPNYTLKSHSKYSIINVIEISVLKWHLKLSHNRESVWYLVIVMLT